MVAMSSLLLLAVSANTLSATPPRTPCATALWATPPSTPPPGADVVGTAPSEPRPFLRLLDGVSSRADMLPAGMVSDWPTWVLDGDGFAKVPDGVDDAERAEGWVNPSSCDDLWLAPDLPPPAARLCLGVHVRGGTLRHVMPAVDLAVDAGGASWRNRGMRTLPRAHTWLGVGANLPSELRVWHGDASYDCGPALARVVEALADDPPDALGAGSHVVHVVVEGAPPLDEPEAGDTLTVALADALYDPADVAEVDKAGMLEVLVLETGAGGESEYLPAAYKPLYGR